MTETHSNDTFLGRPVDRRRLLQGALALGAGAALGPFGALGQRLAGAEPGRGRGSKKDPGYGPLSPVRDQTTGELLLQLPPGFEYLSMGRRGELMSDGIPTPGAHDGMAAFAGAGSLVRLVRNHELGAGKPFGPGEIRYDPRAAGGTTTLVFDGARGQLVESYASLGGTIRNCAGGPTPDGTWLTCEETTDLTRDPATNEIARHGYVFEVPADGRGDGTPLTAMGRFSHEATATDPETGIVYLTEDTGDSVLYRFVPTDRHDLTKGGKLQAMVLGGSTSFADRVITTPWPTGQSAAVTGWADIAQPDPAPRSATNGNPPDAETTRRQGQNQGAAVISRGEGAWYDKGVIYVVSTNGGPVRQGQVFALDLARQTFTSIFSSPSADVLNAPDNICVAPKGGIVLCEDGTGVEYLHGLSKHGEIFKLAANNIGDGGGEWAGACFDPSGTWLFANLQSSGHTFAITGPWHQGPLN